MYWSACPAALLELIRRRRKVTTLPYVGSNVIAVCNIPAPLLDYRGNSIGPCFPRSCFAGGGSRYQTEGGNVGELRSHANSHPRARRGAGREHDLALPDDYR